MSLTNTEFLSSLKDLLAPNSQHPSTCFLTQKRFTYQPDGDTVMENDQHHPVFKCLFRATDGRGLKLSTLVEPEQASEFQKAYSSVLKSSLIGKLKPKKKKAGKSTMTTVFKLPKIVGPRRGAGVEKRRRLVQKRIKMLIKMRSRQLLKAATKPTD